MLSSTHTPILSDLSLQLLPLLAPFRSYITLAEELFNEYLTFLVDTTPFSSIPVTGFYTMIHELIEKGWLCQVLSNWEVYAIHPVLSVHAAKLSTQMQANEQLTLLDTFVRYYTDILVPNAIEPYILAPDIPAQNIGRFIMQFEAENVETVVSRAITQGKVGARVYTCLDNYWQAVNMDRDRLRLSESLLTQIKESKENVDVHLTILFLRSNALQSMGKYAEAEGTTKKALALLPQSDNRQAIILQQLGTILYALGKHGDILAYFEAALAIYQETEDEEKMAEIFQNIGLFSREVKDHDTFFSYTQLALNLYEKQKRSRFQAMAYRNLAVFWLEQTQYDQALGWYKKSLEIMESFGDQVGIATVYQDIGILHSKAGNLVEAKAHFQKAVEIFIGEGYPDQLGKIWFDYGSVALKLGELSEALTYYQKAVNVYDSPKGKGDALHMIAYVHSHYQKNPEASISIYQEAITAFELVEKGKNWMEARYNLGNAFLILGKFRDAIPCYEAVIFWVEAERKPVTTTTAYVVHNLTVACYKAGEYQKGKRYFKKAQKWYRELMDEVSFQELVKDVKEIGINMQD
ncbi:MAG: tetratricopeptide repeat protein [Bacteroidota bacterium]